MKQMIYLVSIKQQWEKMHSDQEICDPIKEETPCRGLHEKKMVVDLRRKSKRGRVS
jgi:hypothetical protein